MTNAIISNSLSDDGSINSLSDVTRDREAYREYVGTLTRYIGNIDLARALHNRGPNEPVDMQTPKTHQEILKRIQDIERTRKDALRAIEVWANDERVKVGEICGKVGHLKTDSQCVICGSWA